MLKKILLGLWLGFCLVKAAAVQPPKLILGIVIDQMRYDYLERYYSQFTTNGFRRLIDHGAVMNFARYDYYPTLTGPGHASIYSGAPPSLHGIIGNEWYVKATGKTLNCVGDSSVVGVGTTNSSKGQASPRNFIGANFADQMRLHYHSKVIGISMKDRGAILPAGKKPAGAFWFDSSSGNFITSSYYMKELPDWVKNFNAAKQATNFIGSTWSRISEERFYEDPDEAAGEGNLTGEKKPIFNHTINLSKDGYDTIVTSPYGNELLLDFAKAALEGETLGQSSEPDLLCISFSSLDAVGHKFGPYSQEVQDLMLRLDRQLASLFDFVDQKVGLNNVWILLTADHGIAPTPEYASAQGFQGKRFEEKVFATNLVKRLNQQFGEDSYLRETNLYNGHLFLNHATLGRKNVPVKIVTDFIREYALESGLFHACYSREQLLDGRAPGYVGKLVLQGYNAERGGDVVLVAKPFVIAGTEKTGTSHGSPFSFDTHIPLLFYGNAFKPGRYDDEFYITDIVPTLCSALQMDEPPGSIGKPFVPVLSSR